MDNKYYLIILQYSTVMIKKGQYYSRLAINILHTQKIENIICLCIKTKEARLEKFSGNYFYL